MKITINIDGKLIYLLSLSAIFGTLLFNIVGFDYHTINPLALAVVMTFGFIGIVQIVDWTFDNYTES